MSICCAVNKNLNFSATHLVWLRKYLSRIREQRKYTRTKAGNKKFTSKTTFIHFVFTSENWF